jgi:hypothetical protein
MTMRIEAYSPGDHRGRGMGTVFTVVTVLFGVVILVLHCCYSAVTLLR